jgi:hypothetical protein
MQRNDDGHGDSPQERFVIDIMHDWANHVTFEDAGAILQRITYLRYPGTLYALQPNDPETGYVLGALDYASETLTLQRIRDEDARHYLFHLDMLNALNPLRERLERGRNI